jgi:hypothetical protein
LCSLFHFLCIYFLSFTVFIFRHCLLSRFASSSFIFYTSFSFFSFLVRLSFFYDKCQMMPFSFPTSLYIGFERHCSLTSVQLSV